MSHEKSFVAELIRQKEDLRIEFMSSYSVPAVLKVVCSFLNTEGGWLLIGYTGKEVHGISDNIEEKVSTLKTTIAEEIFPQPLVDVRIEKYEDQHTILLNVIKGSRQPYSYQRKYFIRSDGTSREATPDEISLLLRTSNEYASTWEKQTAIDATLEDLVSEEINETMREARRFGRGKSLPESVPDFLNYFQLNDMNFVKNGCVVLYGKDPVKFIPQCQIRITVMPYGKTGSRFDDTVLIEDNLFVAYNRVHEYFTRTLPMVSQFKHDDWNRENRERYPIDGLDEAILNAMVHRDYADLSGDVTINVFPDRIEITNSGEVPADIIVGKNNIKEHHSILRNPTIAHMFYLRGKIEKLGRGLNLIKKSFLEYGLRAPEWTTQNGYTTLTLFSVRRDIEFNERMFAFLRHRKMGDQFSREDFEHFFERNISEKTARLDLSKLLDGGWIERIGSGPSTKYIRTNKELPDITG